MKYPWLEISQQLQSIAQAGLTFAEGKYDLERYEQIMEMSRRIIADFTDIEYEKVKHIFSLEKGYLTPKVDVRGVVIRDNKVLLVKETIDGRWSMPGGWADVGFTPKEIAEKEVWEESGLKVKADKLLAVLDKKCHPHPPDIYYVYKMFILCHETGGELNPGMETSEASFFDLKNLPELSEPRNTRSQIEMVFQKVKNNDFTAIVD